LIVISHRGNINGPDILTENNPEHIDKLISKNIFVEVDVWFVDGNYFLGHDSPTYLVDYSWFDKNKNYLWIHAKNQKAFELLFCKKNLNVFWHENDKMTLTSKGYMWLYPENFSKKGITVVLNKPNQENLKKMFGVCTDYFYEWNKL